MLGGLDFMDLLPAGVLLILSYSIRNSDPFMSGIFVLLAVFAFVICYVEGERK